MLHSIRFNRIVPYPRNGGTVWVARLLLKDEEGDAIQQIA